MKTAQFEFDEGLAVLLGRSMRSGPFEYSFSGPQSVKHLIESLGVPHTEIGEVHCGDQRVALDYQVQSGDAIKVQSTPPGGWGNEEPRFALDGHLGRLSASLRMLGFDCLYESNFEDEALAKVAIADGRYLLTRDRHLLMRKSVVLGYLVRSLDPNDQLSEVTRRFALVPMFHPFRRCIRCNTLLQPVEKAAVIDRLQPLTRRYFETFHICPRCGQIYWQGSHVDRMLELIAKLRWEATQEGDSRRPAST